jgi:hypothetical protein
MPVINPLEALVHLQTQKKFIYPVTRPSSSGVFLFTSGLWPQRLGRALAALRSIGMANRYENKHSA